MQLYALAAGTALAWSTPAHAEVLFTPSNHVLAGKGQLEIDLDHNGAVDFILIITQVVRCSSVCSTAGKLEVDGFRPGNRTGVDAQEKAAALRRSAQIGSGRYFLSRALMATGYWNNTGPWNNVNNRFLGVKFLVNGETHYGWIGFRSVTAHLDVTATLAGWAHETQPDTLIIAGDKGTAVPLAERIQPTSLEILSTGHAGMEQRRERATTLGGR